MASPRAFALSIFAVVAAAATLQWSATADSHESESPYLTAQEWSMMAMEWPMPEPGMVSTYAYTSPDGMDMVGYVAAPLGMSDAPPVVLIVPDWDGISAYEKDRAKLYAMAGYAAFVIDIYGGGLATADSAEHSFYASIYRGNFSLFKERIQAGVDAAAEFAEMMPGVYNASNMVLTGYCFGGQGVVQAMLEGEGFNESIKGAIVFHPSTGGVNLTDVMPLPYRLSIQAGGADAGHPLNGTERNVTGLWDIEAAMSAAGGDFEIQVYAGAPHSFTNHYSSAFDEGANQLSFEAAMQLIDLMVGGPEAVTMAAEAPRYEELPPDAPAGISWMWLNYTDPADGAELQSYVAYNASLAEMAMANGTMLPVVLVVQDWTGQDEHEVHRANMLASEGYIAVCSDVYARGYLTLSQPERIEQSGFYRANRTLFVSRQTTAVDAVRDALEFASPNQTAAMGFCFGGTGIVEMLLSGIEYDLFITYHGSPASALAAGVAPGVNISTPLLIWSGSDDTRSEPAEVVDELLKLMDEADMAWELVRFSDTPHGFMEWSGSAYREWADARAWASTIDVLHDIFGHHQWE